MKHCWNTYFNLVNVAFSLIPSANAIAPLGSLMVTVVQFSVLLLFAYEVVLPTCRSDADCKKGTFCPARS